MCTGNNPFSLIYRLLFIFYFLFFSLFFSPSNYHPQVALYSIIETSPVAIHFQDPSLLSMVHFLRNNKDCARLRVRQRWFALKKGATSRRDEVVGGGEEEGVDGEDVGDEEEEYGSGSIPMDLLEHVKKAVKEFQASMAITGKILQYLMVQIFIFSLDPNSETSKSNDRDKEETADFQKRILPWQMLDVLPQVSYHPRCRNFFKFVFIF
jgi:hypothetical protein